MAGLAILAAIPAASLPSAGAAAALAGGALAIDVGMAMGVVGQLQAGKAAAAQAKGAEAMAEYNARVAQQEAMAIEARTGFEQKRAAQEAERRQSRLRAALAASGAVPSVGAPLLLQTTQAEESELEMLLIGYEGQIGASRARSQAELDRMQARIYGKRAGTARTTGYIGAGTTLLRGFGQAASRFT